MTKPMSDGGKGSVRRNEDTEAYRNNFDNIFGARAPVSSPSAAGKKEPMIDDEEYERSEDFEEDDTCTWCGGCGEGDYDGASCRHCGGTGVEPYDNSNDIGECYDIDDLD